MVSEIIRELEKHHPLTPEARSQLRVRLQADSSLRRRACGHVGANAAEKLIDLLIGDNKQNRAE